MREIEHRSGPERYSRSGRSRGSEILEFSLVLMPFFTLFFLQLTMCYWIFAKVTLQQAVRRGARYGVTNDIDLLRCKPGGPTTDLTSCIKNEVQWAAGGFLSNDTGRAYIKVRYCLPPVESSAAACAPKYDASANTGNNILQVSVENFKILPLFPVLPSWANGPDTGGMTFNVYSADRIEPGGSPPPVGAPDAWPP
jgi:hypothetical protein